MATAEPVPPIEVLTRLDADAWAQLLVATRRALEARGARTDPEREVLTTSTGRLVAGSGRQRAMTVLAGDAELWGHVRADPTAATAVKRVTAAMAARVDRSASEGVGSTGAADPADVGRAKLRARRAREERDAWQRRAEGAEARVGRLESEAASVQARLREVEEQLAAAQAQLAAQVEEQTRAVERERRRRDGEIAKLEEQLRTARAALEEQRQAARQAARRRQAPPREEVAATTRRGEPDPEEDRTTRLVPGRPSRLPDGVAAGTTDAASLLLHPGRKVLIDGYNVTRQHRSHLDLETQRNWLVQLLATGVAMRRIRPVVVFDGEQAGGSRAGVGTREVEVRFTSSGISADDELVFAVEATDEPVVVVTDDRELIDRVRAGGADVLSTVSFLGAVSSAPS